MELKLSSVESTKRNEVRKSFYVPPPPEDYSKNFIRLGAVCGIAVIFIAVEVVGGTLAHSVAIISDAIHLVSDLVAFIFSFVFLYLSKKRMDKKASFGYHRMELLGALVNLVIVWALVLIVLIEATLRIVNKEFVREPKIMAMTAGFGVVVNIVLFKVLHGGATHSHGLMHDSCAGHGHGHDHSHSHGDHHHHSHEHKHHHTHHSHAHAHAELKEEGEARNDESSKNINKDD